MIKRIDLERHLRAHGCELLREGGAHAIWWNSVTGARRPVPRHREIPTGTARSICNGLGVPAP